MQPLVVQLSGEAAQAAFGARLARACEAPLLVFLDGQLGAGKTTLVRGLLRELGQTGAVRSPTYTLVEPYEVGGTLVYHLDLYRIADPDELEYLGLRDLLAEPALVFVEWPDRGAGWLPQADLHIHIALAGEGRRLTLEPLSGRGDQVCRQLAGDL